MKTQSCLTLLVVVTLLLSGCMPISPDEIHYPFPADPNLIQQSLVDLVNSAKFGSNEIPPPIDRLKELAELLNSMKSELATDAKFDFAPESFKLSHATTYVLPGIGAIFQLVSLSDAGSKEFDLDALLRSSKSWESKALPIGGILVYQDLPFENVKLSPGAYAVLLRREDGVIPKFEILSADKSIEPATGDWILRRLDSERLPFSFVISKQICFSQYVYQGCLQYTAPGFDQTSELIT